MMEDGVCRLQEFSRAEEKRGPLCNLTFTQGLSSAKLVPTEPRLCLPHQYLGGQINKSTPYPNEIVIIIPATSIHVDGKT